MSKIITGEEAMEWLKASPIEFYMEHISKGLQPHDGAGRALKPSGVIAYLIGSWQDELHYHEDTASHLTELEREEIHANRIHPLQVRITEAQSLLSSLNSDTWEDFKMPESRDLEDMFLWCLVKACYREDDVKPVDAEITATPAETPTEHVQPVKDSSKETHKELPRDRHRRQTRAVAKRLWDKHPKMTRPDMARHPDVMEASKKANGKYYEEKTVKGWIKDFDPNPPLKGRPKKNPRKK